MKIIKLCVSIVIMFLSYYLVDMGFKYPTKFQIPIHLVSIIMFSYSFVYLFKAGNDRLLTPKEDP